MYKLPEMVREARGRIARHTALGRRTFVSLSRTAAGRKGNPPRLVRAAQVWAVRTFRW